MYPLVDLTIDEAGGNQTKKKKTIFDLSHGARFFRISRNYLSYELEWKTQQQRPFHSDCIFNLKDTVTIRQRAQKQKESNEVFWFFASLHLLRTRV